MTSSQETLDLAFASSGGLFVHVKPYLQPFERQLAERELIGLCGPSGIIANLEGFTVSDISKFELLKSRLAYAQTIELSGNSALTEQVLRELSQSGDPNILSKIHRTRRLRFGPHDIHEYRGKFFPQLVRSLLNFGGVMPGQVVLDPMVGSGTTTAEAAALGISSIGVDKNPLSVAIAQAKTLLASGSFSEADASILLQVSTRLDEGLPVTVAPEEQWDETTLGYLQRWFDSSALVEISQCLELIREFSPDLQLYMKVVLSNIMRGVSNQDEEDLRVRKKEKNFSSGQVLSNFSQGLKKLVEQMQRYNSVNIASRNPGATPNTSDIRIGDARRCDLEFSSHLGKVDCVVTSPPYATALPYLDTDRLSLLALKLIEKRHLRSIEREMIGTREISEGLRRQWWHLYEKSSSVLTEEICDLVDFLAKENHSDDVGFRRRNLPSLLGKYFIDMFENLNASIRLVKPGGMAFYVVGSNSTKVNGQKVVIQTDKLLYDLAGKCGWEQIELIDMEMLPSRDLFRENTGDSEKILVLRRPA